MVLTDVPKQAARLGFRVLHLPMHLAKMAGLDVEAWPPVAAYEAVEAEAKKALAGLLGDGILADEGRLQSEAALRRLRAARLAGEAERVAAEADERLERRSDSAERAREQAEEAAAERLEEIEAEEEKARAEVHRRATQREAAAKRAARARQKAVEAKERQAQLAGVEAETRAVEKEREALVADEVVTRIEDHLGNGRRSV